MAWMNNYWSVGQCVCVCVTVPFLCWSSCTTHYILLTFLLKLRCQSDLSNTHFLHYLIHSQSKAITFCSPCHSHRYTHTHTVFTYLRITLAEAPHCPDTHHADAQSTHRGIDVHLLLSHDKEADCHDTKSGHYQPIPIRFPFNHLCERCWVTKLLLKSRHLSHNEGRLCVVLCLKVRVEEAQLLFHSAGYYSLQTAWTVQV